MSAPTEAYRIVVSGYVLKGKNPRDVAESFAKLLKLDVEKAGHYLKGEPRVIKKRADKATAMKYHSALTSIGVDASIEPMVSEPESGAHGARASSLLAHSVPDLSMIEPDCRQSAADKTSGPIMVCLACHTVQTEAEKCRQCGVYAGKARTMREAAAIEAPEAREGHSLEDIREWVISAALRACPVVALLWIGVAIAFD